MLGCDLSFFVRVESRGSRARGLGKAGRPRAALHDRRDTTARADPDRRADGPTDGAQIMGAVMFYVLVPTGWLDPLAAQGSRRARALARPSYRSVTSSRLATSYSISSGSRSSQPRNRETDEWMSASSRARGRCLGSVNRSPIETRPMTDPSTARRVALFVVGRSNAFSRKVVRVAWAISRRRQSSLEQGLALTQSWQLRDVDSSATQRLERDADDENDHHDSSLQSSTLTIQSNLLSV